MLLSTRLVQRIEDHAEELTRGVVQDLQSNPRTPSYHALPIRTIERRAYDVYRNLGKWLTTMSDEEIESAHHELARRRSEEAVPLSELLYALILTKYHLRNYISASGMVDSAVQLYQEQELQHLIGRFFDKAVYYTARGYERARRARPMDEEPVHQA
jgi:hypothetical protein